jgi:hypothetical protein
MMPMIVIDFRLQSQGKRYLLNLQIELMEFGLPCNSCHEAKLILAHQSCRPRHTVNRSHLWIRN